MHGMIRGYARRFGDTLRRYCIELPSFLAVASLRFRRSLSPGSFRLRKAKRKIEISWVDNRHISVIALWSLTRAPTLIY